MRFSFPSWKKSLLWQGVLAVTLGAGGLALPGCVTTMPGWMGGEPTTLPNGAPLGQPVNIVSLWDKELQMAPDPTKGGQKGPCLVGRMLLFSKEHKASKAVCCEGHLTINLWDERPGAPPQSVEWWKIDKETLRKMAVKDELGWGYTLALPTEKAQYISKGRVELVFEPDHGDKMFASSGPMWFTTTNITVNSRTETPFKSTIVPPGQQLGQPNYQPQQQPLQPQQQPQQPFQNGQPRQQSFQGPAQQQFAPLQQVGLQQVQPFTPGQQPQQFAPGQAQQYGGQPQQFMPGQQGQQYGGQPQFVPPQGQQFGGQPQQFVPPQQGQQFGGQAQQFVPPQQGQQFGGQAQQFVPGQQGQQVGGQPQQFGSSAMPLGIQLQPAGGDLPIQVVTPPMARQAAPPTPSVADFQQNLMQAPGRPTIQFAPDGMQVQQQPSLPASGGLAPGNAAASFQDSGNGQRPSLSSQLMLPGH